MSIEGVEIVEHTEESAREAIGVLLAENGAEVEELQVQAKGRGVWFATVRLVGEDHARQGIYTDERLSA